MSPRKLAFSSSHVYNRRTFSNYTSEFFLPMSPSTNKPPSANNYHHYHSLFILWRARLDCSLFGSCRCTAYQAGILDNFHNIRNEFNPGRIPTPSWSSEPNFCILHDEIHRRWQPIRCIHKVRLVSCSHLSHRNMTMT